MGHLSAVSGLRVVNQTSIQEGFGSVEMRFQVQCNKAKTDFFIRSECHNNREPFESEREAVEWLIAKVNDDAPYADFVMERANGERIIGNGDQLIEVMESMVYWDDYVDHVIERGAI